MTEQYGKCPGNPLLSPFVRGTSPFVLSYIPENRQMIEITEEIARMLHGLIKSVANGAREPSKPNQ